MDEINQATPNSIYTIGHSNHSLEIFIHLLRSHDIQVLIDTRSAPFSRYSPQFNRGSLKAAVQEAGIKYGFYGRQLGGRPDDEDFYDQDGRVVYSEVAKSFLFKEGLERLVNGLSKFRTALLCSEENPSVCHRRLLVSRVLFEQGINVYHIRGDGRLESERELQTAEAHLVKERERKAEEKRLAAERKLQDEEGRCAARRKLYEDTIQRKLQCQQASEAARLEKERVRRQKAEQQAAERERRTNERERASAERKIQRGKARQRIDVPKKAELPKLFDMEEI